VPRPAGRVWRCAAITVRYAKEDGTRRGQFTEEQIIGLLKEAEAGKLTKEICREHGIAEPTFYRWKRSTAG
jgi:putative transposase